jgi:hypothetical protein
MLFRETVTVYCENHTNAEFSMLKQVVLAALGFQGLWGTQSSEHLYNEHETRKNSWLYFVHFSNGEQYQTRNILFSSFRSLLTQKDFHFNLVIKSKQFCHISIIAVNIF